MKRSSSLGILLTVALVFFSMVVVGVSLYFLSSIKHISSISTDLATNDVERLQALDSMDRSLLRFYGDVLANVETLPEQRTELTNTQASLNYQVDQYKQHSNAQSKEILDAIGEQSNAVFSAATNLIQLREQGASQANLLAARAALNAAEQKALTLFDSELVKERQQIQDAQIANRAAVQNAYVASAIVAVIALIVAGAIGLILSLRIIRSIGILKEGANRAANGDLSRPIMLNTHDELGDLAAAFNQMLTRLRDSYQRLALEKRRDDVLLSSIGDGLIAVDRTGTIVLANHVAASLLERPNAAALSKQPANTVLPQFLDDRGTPIPPAQLPIPQVLQTAKQINTIMAYKGDDGKVIALGITASPVIGDGNAVEGVVMAMRDVTHDREVDRMKTEFISLASHQLRTPLSAIKWFSEMLLSGDAGALNPEQQDFAKNVSDSTERMIDLVNSLLNISRIESGRIIVDPKPTDLSELVNGVVQDLKAKIEERHQNLIVSVNRDLPKINLDPHLIGQVYLNLLTNAIKYTPKGGEITVFVSRKDDWLVSQVTDNGYGIPKSQQGKIFQRFFRAENITKIETDGTGLGLYLIKAIVESSGGKIWFQSEEGKGTTFWFSLPMSGMKPHKGEVTLDG